MINSLYAYQYVYDAILKELQERGADERTELPSEKEYCERFDVSLTTVRRALDRLYKENIIVKIKGKGSFISHKVRKLKCEKNRFIGVLMIPFGDVQENVYEARYHYLNPYAQKIYKTIFCELSGEYDLLIDTLENAELEKKFPDSVLNNVEKIFIIGETRRESIEYLHSRGKCVVAYNFFEKDIAVAKVNNDERLQYKNITEYFIRQGHKKIACINGVNFYSEAIERYMGFQDAMVVNDIYIDNKFIKWSNMTPESGYYLTKELLSLAELPTVIICVNDGVAMGAYDAITEAGLVVNRDIYLSGHDNCEMENDKYNVINTIDPDYVGVGKEIAMILRRETWIDEEIIHPSKIIIR